MAIALPLKLKDLLRRKLRARLFGDRQFVDEVFNVHRIYHSFKQNGILLQTAVDIGANTGQWAKIFKHHFPEASLLSIEANPDNLATLQKVNPNSVQACLAEVSGEQRTFFFPNPSVERNNTGASLYREVLPGYQDPICLQLETVTLDSFGQHFDLIKLDVQGGELDILRGSTIALRHAKIVMLEVSLKQYNQSAPLAAELIAFLHEKGFVFVAINEVLCYRNSPIQLDCCFARSSFTSLVHLDS